MNAMQCQFDKVLHPYAYSQGILFELPLKLSILMYGLLAVRFTFLIDSYVNTSLRIKIVQKCTSYTLCYYTPRSLGIDVDSALGFLFHVELRNVVGVSDVHTASIFRIEMGTIDGCLCICSPRSGPQTPSFSRGSFGEGGIIFLRNVGKINHIHTVWRPRTRMIMCENMNVEQEG